jgi:uncharacterized protein YicC (UPF0701 family)
MATKKGPKTPMTNEHKEALARGRAEGKAVRDYLEALRANKPRRGRKRTPESINRRITAIDSEIMNADPLTELKLVEERRRLLEDLTTIGNKVDIEQLEKAFVSVAKSYGQRQGISYASWREVGVEARVLRAAGLGRSS